MRGKLAPDRAVAAIAVRQGGVVSRAQLLALGLSPPSIDRRLAAGRLHRIRRGVYAVGHPLLGVDGRRWAAVLALGDRAVVSHATAASAWDVRRTSSGLIHVTVPDRGGRTPRTGIQVHRPSAWHAGEVTALSGLPITTPARTLLDLAAAGVRGRPLEAALDRAELLGLVDFAELDHILARHAGRPGCPALTATLSRYTAGSTRTRSVLEELVLEACERHAILRPRVNAIVEGRERDFFWPQSRLIVEADSYAWHRSPSALDDDRERDAELLLAGYRCLRFTWPQVTRRRSYVVRTLVSALGAP